MKCCGNVVCCYDSPLKLRLLALPMWKQLDSSAFEAASGCNPAAAAALQSFNELKIGGGFPQNCICQHMATACYAH